jgi:glutathione S-transferase
MCLMELAGQPWKPKFTPDPRKAPKAKLPVLVDGDKTIADSDQIRDYLESTYAIDFDAGLDDTQRATSRAVIRMMEEHTYFAVVCDRWMNDGNWAHLRKAYFGHLPFPLFGLITRQVRKQAAGQVKNQGMGRHSEEERFARVVKDVDSITALLAGKPFLFGDKPTAADLSAVPFLRAGAGTPEATQLSRRINDDANLTAYLERGMAAFYPDKEMWTKPKAA